MPFTDSFVHSVLYISLPINVINDQSVLVGKITKNILVILFSTSCVFHARDLHHPRATKPQLGNSTFTDKLLFFSNVRVSFQIGLNLLLQRFSGDFFVFFFCAWIFHVRDLNDPRATKSTISKMFSKTSFNTFSVCRFRQVSASFCYDLVVIIKSCGLLLSVLHVKTF